MNRVSEPFVRSKMAITLELKPCLSNFSRGIEKQNSYLGRNIEFSSGPADIFLIPYF